MRPHAPIHFSTQSLDEYVFMKGVARKLPSSVTGTDASLTNQEIDPHSADTPSKTVATVRAHKRKKPDPAASNTPDKPLVTIDLMASEKDDQSKTVDPSFVWVLC